MADVLETDGGEPSTPWRALTETRRSISAVLSNRNLRRIELAFAGSAIGDWAYATAVAVWAYGEGGAKAVGIWMAIRYALMAVSAPFSATLADKMSAQAADDPGRPHPGGADHRRGRLPVPRHPGGPVYVLATLAALLATPFLVAQRSLLPSLAERPEELTAANGTASTIEALAFFAGPALAAVLLGFTTVQVVFLAQRRHVPVVDGAGARRAPCRPSPRRRRPARGRRARTPRRGSSPRPRPGSGRSPATAVSRSSPSRPARRRWSPAPRWCSSW